MLKHSFAAPLVPSVTAVARLSGANGIIGWDSITPEKARGFLTTIQVAYETSDRGESDACPMLTAAKEVVTFNDTYDLNEISTYSIPDLIPDKEYCFAVQASTSAGPSGYSSPIRMTCK
jgi:hypothetical protein